MSCDIARDERLSTRIASTRNELASRTPVGHLHFHVSVEKVRSDGSQSGDALMAYHPSLPRVMLGQTSCAQYAGRLTVLA
jgi:hypothetical protein